MKTVIIPTLNEEANIGRLIPAIYDHLGLEGVSVVVVDDDSIDRTCEVVERLSEDYTVKLLERKGRRGISSAVLYASKIAGNGHIAVMDADFSHHPKYLPALFKKIRIGYDVAVGSRYVTGGGVNGWPSYRLFLSLGATVLAKLLFRFPVRDPMSGYAAFKSSQILIDGIKDSESKFLLDVLASVDNLRVVEIPIVFHNRKLGSSKLTGITLYGYLDQILSRYLLHGKRRALLDKIPVIELPVDSVQLASLQQTDISPQ
ncbi:MAG: glycosyltransferase [Candidatus Thorarchaeota archaeon]|jgi:dolichol-phosphate mannosyltransferase